MLDVKHLVKISDDRPTQWEGGVGPSAISPKSQKFLQPDDSLREAMSKMNISTGGKNGHELKREVKNFAAAEIGIGVWDDTGDVHHHRALVAPHMSFWLEKNPNQRTIWQP
jgi:hypothetical protein